MNRPGALFIIGNKRSGSSLMVNLLNLHPNVLITHEADVAWILYQISRESKDEIDGYPLDDAKGLKATLEFHGDLFQALRMSSNLSTDMLKNVFYEFYARINQHGRGEWDDAAQKRSLAWIGDKKPVQQADPSIWSFLTDLFPRARFLHVIRDPRYVVASMLEASDTWNEASVPAHWHGTAESVFSSWIRNEERVLQIKKRAADRLHTVRLEDLAARPGDEMHGVMRFLDLTLPVQMDELISQMVWERPNRRHEPADLPVGRERFGRILEMSGYREDRSSA